MALATSKRKFYKLLDNLSTSKTTLSTTDNGEKSSSTTSLARPAVDSEPPLKRTRLLDLDRRPQRDGASTGSARVSRARSASMSNTFTGTSYDVDASTTPRPTSVRIISSTFGETTWGARRRQQQQQQQQQLVQQQQGDSPPGARLTSTTYAPWSQEQFLGRLKTFADVRSWTSKPEQVGELVWAKRGWAVVGTDEVSCRACGKRLIVKLDKEEDKSRNEVEKTPSDDGKWWLNDMEKRLVERYESLVIEAHDQNCLWRKAGCKDDIYRIRFADQSVWKNALDDRYSSLVAIESAMPGKLNLPEYDEQTQRVKFDIDDLAKFLATDLLSSPEKENETTVSGSSNKVATKINQTAVALALCGWSGLDMSGVRLAYCTNCFQRVGLWLYNIKGGSSAVDDTTMSFNPITLHRDHCPWQNRNSQRALGNFAGFAGWQVQVELIHGKMMRDERKLQVVVPDTEDVFLDTPMRSKEQVASEDKVREGKLARLRRAFSVKKLSR